MARLLLLPLLLSACTACASTGGTAPIDRVSLQEERNRLDRGLPDWQETTLRFSREWDRRHLVEGELARVRRFGLEDAQWRLGYTRPLSPALTGSVEAGASPTHRVLARHVLGARLQYEFQPAWLVHGGLRRTSYNDGQVHQAQLALERYVGNFGLLAGWTPARALGQSTNTVEGRATWYHGDRSSVGVIAAAGDEATQLPGGRVVLAAVRSIALVGRQDLAPGWSLLYGAQRVRQGDFYNRTGATLGLQAAF